MRKKFITHYFKHVLVEKFFVLLPEFLENDITKFWKIYEAIPHDVVGQVDYLLFHGVEAQHLHGRVEVLRVDGGLPQAGLVAPEDRRDDVQLLLGQFVPDLEHLSGDT